MGRLTNKDGSYDDYVINNLENPKTCLGKVTINNILTHKLCQYEDIDEEFGIEWNTLSKVLKNGFYAKEIHTKDNIQIYHVEPEEFVITFGKVLGHFITIQELYFEDLDGVLDTTGKKWYPEDYGITWALTREELEKDDIKKD